MVKERSQQLLSGTGLFERVHNLAGKGLNAVRNVVGQVGVLGMRPDLLHGVEVRSVGWKPFDQEFAVEALHQRRAVEVGTVFRDLRQPGGGYLAAHVTVDEVRIPRTSGAERDAAQPDEAQSVEFDLSYSCRHRTFLRSTPRVHTHPTSEKLESSVRSVNGLSQRYAVRSPQPTAAVLEWGAAFWCC